MALWDKVRQGIDKAGKAAQDVFDEGKLRLDAYRAREAADEAAQVLGYAVFRAAEAGSNLEADARSSLMDALRTKDIEAHRLETELANSKEGENAPATAESPPDRTSEAEGRPPAEGGAAH